MFNDRKKLEELEEKNLAGYACLSSKSKGRCYPDEEPDYRTAFQRDRDRILHTTAFRRLEYKTQVFINTEGDYYRTRLTHSLEVAQIGRTIARALGANEDLVEAICLAHDIGHPPFGHSGEAALAKLMKDNGGFDHNKQSLRVVTLLERRFAEFPGLNLSWEVLEGMVKHESEYDVSDASDFDPHLLGHLEAQITNLADELAYTAHDLDDGLRSGMIIPDQLENLALWKTLVETIGWDGENLLDDTTRHRLIRLLIGIEVTDLLQATNDRIQHYQVKTREDVQKLDCNLVGFSEELQARNRELKSLLYQQLYRHWRVLRMQTKAERFLSDLFEAYLAEPNVLPDSARLTLDEIGPQRTICDYLAGMTDRYALDEHARLFDPTTLP
ncbi:MAG: deoxyguanosinetriphosphate triphosphohydrolase [Anaerolineaceae bacterium]|nr:deoxyguanosinetriphosphate triphosphohydrolase [Anaerolineaceae bacterium]